MSITDTDHASMDHGSMDHGSMDHGSMDHGSTDRRYKESLALTIISAIFLVLGAVCALIIVVDIVWRRGWRSMMLIMIPVYPINAAYMLPLELYVYLKFGRPTRLDIKDSINNCHCHKASGDAEQGHCGDGISPSTTESMPAVEPISDHEGQPPSLTADAHGCHGHDTEATPDTPMDAEAAVSHCNHHESNRPMWATVLVGVSHCGAGCVLGDIVGEWLVYGTNATLGGEMLWPALLVDYAFALLFGIVFQYFSIAPMTGEYGPKTVWRALKADILSLTSFEIGAFGWMIVYQVAIFGYRLEMTTLTYWWMMQVGMVLGFATAFPVNWLLISMGIKEPCA